MLADACLSRFDVSSCTAVGGSVLVSRGLAFGPLPAVFELKHEVQPSVECLCGWVSPGVNYAEA